MVGTKQTIITEHASDKPTHLIRKSFNGVEEKKRLRWDVRNKDKLCALTYLIRLYTGLLYEGFYERQRINPFHYNMRLQVLLSRKPLTRKVRTLKKFQ